MMKKQFITILILITGLFGFTISANAGFFTDFFNQLFPSNKNIGATILYPSGGGTGTSTAPTYGQMLVGNSGGTYTLTATSSLGITQDLSGYVPYTGASQDVDLGASGISADWILVGTNGASSVDLYNSSRIDFFSDTGETVLGRLNMSGAGLFNFNPTTTLGGIKGILDFSGLTTSDKTFTFPNWSGNFLIASSTSLTVGASGNVGIGTAGPLAKLDVNGAVLINGMTYTGQGAIGVQQSANTNTNGITVYNYGATGSIRWWVDANAVMRLDSLASANGNISINGAGSGNVGIGTTSPSFKLELGSGQLALPYGTYDKPSLTFSSDSATGIYGGGTGDFRIIVGGTDNFHFTTASNIIYNNKPLRWTNSNVQINRVVNTLTLSSYDGLKYINTSASRTDFVIDNSGNVGIGTTTPAAPLYVRQGNAGIAPAWSAGNDNVIIESAGGSEITFFTPDASGGFQMASPAGRWRAGLYYDATKLDFYSGAAIRMSILSTNGNVGIGTTSPAVKLDINGYAKVLQTSTTTACSSAIEGSIFYNQANHLFWGCNGTNWLSLSN